MSRVEGWKLVTPLIVSVAVGVYFVAIEPFRNPKKWQDLQAKNRAGLDREAIQPGGMKVWSNPFEKEKKEERRPPPSH